MASTDEIVRLDGRGRAPLRGAFIGRKSIVRTQFPGRDRHQRSLHPTLFGRGHMALEQIMRGTETSGHACTIKKVTASWQLYIPMTPCCVLFNTVFFLYILQQCLSSYLHTDWFSRHIFNVLHRLEMHSQPGLCDDVLGTGDSRTARYRRKGIRFTQSEHRHHYWYWCTETILCTKLRIILCWKGDT